MIEMRCAITTWQKGFFRFFLRFFQFLEWRVKLDLVLDTMGREERTTEGGLGDTRPKLVRFLRYIDNVRLFVHEL